MSDHGVTELDVLRNLRAELEDVGLERQVEHVAERLRPGRLFDDVWTCLGQVQARIAAGATPVAAVEAEIAARGGTP